jgi:hypothetical protein
MSPRSSGRRITRGINECEACSKPISCLAYSSTLTMEATCSSETSVNFQQTIWRYIRQNITLRILNKSNLKVLVFQSRAHGELLGIW